MRQKKHSFISMSGNKRALVEQILPPVLNGIDTSCLNYIEPFFGSGGMYCNLPYNFKTYQCSDIFPFVIGFLNSNFSKEKLQMLYEDILGRYKIAESREGYFEYRKFWNEGQIGNDLLRYGGFILLANACINGMIRFGPNGFNQAWGNRTISKDKFLSLSSMIKPNSSFKVCDFRDVTYPHSSVVYFDPPYRGTGALEKMRGFYTWTKEDDDDLILLFSDLDRRVCTLILSTIEDSYLHSILKNYYRIIPINKKYKMAPFDKQAKAHKEIIITNA